MRGFIALFTFLFLLLFDMQIIEKVRKCKKITEKVIKNVWYEKVLE